MRIKKIFVSAVCILLSILLCSCSALGGTESGGGETPGGETHTCYLRKRAARQVTCTLDGNIEYYCCLGCNSYYLDADGKNKITYDETRIPKLEHKNMVHNEGFAPNVEADGEKEHYYCPDCNKYFLDENGEVETNAEDVVLNFY